MAALTLSILSLNHQVTLNVIVDAKALPLLKALFGANKTYFIAVYREKIEAMIAACQQTIKIRMLGTFPSQNLAISKDGFWVETSKTPNSEQVNTNLKNELNY